MVERPTPVLVLTLTWHAHEAPENGVVMTEYTPYVNHAQVDRLIILWRDDHRVKVIRLRSLDNRVVGMSGFVPDSERDAHIRRIFKLKDCDVIRFRQRFTEYVPCSNCGCEIFATRVRRGNPPYWANRSDLQPHACEDFRNMSVDEVKAWTTNMRKRAANYAKRPRKD